MKEINNMLITEVNAFHSIRFQIAGVLVLTQAEFDSYTYGVVTSGVLLGNGTTPILDNPTVPCSPTLGLDGVYSGILAHDVVLEEGVLEYEVGIAIDADVYTDCLGVTFATSDLATLRKQGCKFYNVKTQKAPRA